MLGRSVFGKTPVAQSSRLASVDRHSTTASIVMSLTSPADAALYLLMPAHAEQFGVTLTEAGILLAANRLVRLIGYDAVVSMFHARGDRFTSTIAVVLSAACALAYAFADGFFLLLAARLTWGLCFGALNLSVQVANTAELDGAGARTGLSRGVMAIGPMLCLPLCAWASHYIGYRYVFLGNCALSLTALWWTKTLPFQERQRRGSTPRRRWSRPTSLDAWSFMEGFTLDGLFVIGLSLLVAHPNHGDALVLAAILMASRYASELVFGSFAGKMADRLGAETMLIICTIATAVTLIGFAAGSFWVCGSAVLVLRAFQLPLIAPIVARRFPGRLRVNALVSQSLWRDIGSGAGPLFAAIFFPIIPTVLLFAIPAGILVWSAQKAYRQR